MADGQIESLLGQPSTAIYIEKLRDRGYGEAGITNVAYARRDRFHREFRPHIERALSDEMAPRDRKVVEIGCGAGSVTHAFTEMFAQVTAFEINTSMVDLVRERKDIYGLDTLVIHHLPPAEVVPAAIDAAEPGGVFMLYAVLEHMLESERFETLSALWKAMDPVSGIPDLHIYVGNTPNRLSWQDLHTHQTPFLINLPHETARRYMELNPDINLAAHMLAAHRDGGDDSFATTRARRGLGISFHDFEIAFDGADLNECIVLPDIAQPAQDYDVLLAAFFLNAGIDVPMCFAMRDMNFMIRRPQNADDAARTRAYNAQVRDRFAKTVATRLEAIARKIAQTG
ncbi:class I SAM-dependent methyltransferase [Pukyongiella litopenaei]|uniref:Class I SAM-dependent methyltransferase n=1 Tax=Pukyongiella litopenaei TaxID=2605946 RepID=A0A5C2H947_9RHOB|nr:methyltransferase domain-containing protein [Pukyongiella litopenaei]QEP30319.1 class I SAM-dependent methyltransferase [Pukyongiella litopenaei]